MKVDAVIIDSGVNKFFKDKIVGGINLSVIGEKTDLYDNIGHGSSVLNLILSHSPNASVYIIKACNDYQGFSFERLCESLEHMVDFGIKCKLLNISMGITRLDNFSKLHDLIVRIKEKDGTAIVSAYQNFGLVSYPAGFEEVIGVDCSSSCSKRDDFEYVENSIINVRASSSFYHAFDENEKKILMKGTSFSAANLSGMILKYADNYLGVDFYDKCKNYLRSEAKTVYGYHLDHTSAPHQCSCHEHSYTEETHYIPQCSPSEFLNGKPKAVIFPFNKEMHSIARFESMLNIEIAGYYDHRISMNNNKRVNDVIGCQCSDKTIKPIDELDWNSDFEMVVCGHCDEMCSLTGDNIFGDIIDKCLQGGKKLYCFDNPFEYIKNNIDINNIFFPHVDESMVKQYRFDKLRKSSKPVVGIYGTSSRQGKHTLQLYLRNALTEKGFKVGQLGTEPHGYLFGFDYVYPMSYNSSVYVNGYDSIRILNESMWEIECNEPDIIITGCQSGTVPYNINQLSNINFSTYEFYIGTAPDAVILCVNAFDNIEYIKRTIKFLEGAGNAKVIALVIFPVVKKNGDFILKKDTVLTSDDLEQIRVDLSKQIGIKTYVNCEGDAENLSIEIIGFFSG